MTRLVDDIDGSQAAATLSFSLDGRNYEIDLSESHLSAFQQALAPFVTVARAVPGGHRAEHAPTPRRAPESNGRPVPARDTVAAEVTTARPTAESAVGSAPFRPPAPGREVAAARSKPERAPLVANPFKSQS